MTVLIAEMRQLWQANLKHVLQLVQALSGALGEDFNVYLPDFLPSLMRVIRDERGDPHRPQTVRVLGTLLALTPRLPSRAKSSAEPTPQPHLFVKLFMSSS